ncbi:hypothetical protein TB1_000749 [Malus domestica]
MKPIGNKWVFKTKRDNNGNIKWHKASEYKLSKEQVFEISYGLELSELPFLWALRKPNWAKSEVDALPRGFVDRTSEKGLVCFRWVPQMEILAHPSFGSIGGSIIEFGSELLHVQQVPKILSSEPPSSSKLQDGFRTGPRADPGRRDQKMDLGLGSTVVGAPERAARSCVWQRLCHAS